MARRDRPIASSSAATTVADPGVFRSGREFAAWLGLVPRQNSTGGKTRLGGITKRSHLMPERGQLARPVMGRRARFQPDHTSWNAAEERHGRLARRGVAVCWRNLAKEKAPDRKTGAEVR